MKKTKQVNSVRGTGREKNVSLVVDPSKGLGPRCCPLFAVRDIEAGEEVLWDYDFAREEVKWDAARRRFAPDGAEGADEDPVFSCLRVLLD